MNTVDIETRIKVSSLSGKVGCIVGGSYESGRPQDTNNHLLKGGRYYSLCDMLKAVIPEVHWLNYAQAGSVSSGGIKQLAV